VVRQEAVSPQYSSMETGVNSPAAPAGRLPLS
jgi:hypothetical protein